MGPKGMSEGIKSGFDMEVGRSGPFAATERSQTLDSDRPSNPLLPTTI